VIGLAALLALGASVPGAGTLPYRPTGASAWAATAMTATHALPQALLRVTAYSEVSMLLGIKSDESSTV
jgi:hypothetical protein